jgi:hypothetical protein
MRIHIPLSERRTRSHPFAPSARGESRHWQIGPRIRVGGTLGKIGQNVKNATTKAVVDTGHTIGKVADNKWAQYAAMAALAATGVGAAPAAAMMAAMKGGGKLLKPGGNIGEGLKGGVQGALQGYGASKIGSLARGVIGSVTGGAGAAGGGIQSAGNSGASGDYIPGSAPSAGVNGGEYIPGSAPSAGGGSAGGGSWWDNLLHGGGSDGKGNMGLLGDLGGKFSGAVGSVTGGGGMDKILTAAAVAQQALDAKRQRDLQNEGLGFAKDAYSSRAPLRQRGLQLAQDEGVQDLSSIFANPANPYTRAAVHPSVGTPAPAPVGGATGTQRIGMWRPPTLPAQA